ncbi:protein SHQ1 homolog isoform X2 [Ooceraea biroi]|uniref:protein SHQ1 homolog isoform X2 n=1 Tax=Ooceraea biroi TaxID=2015173 RepID=UPI000F092BBF|nr:protein SHQ1 homolog isoform X2 [Ooceraea biroi]
MLTPRFELSQTDTELAIIIHAPYANIKDAEVSVEGTDFRFFSTPYYLRLKLPGEIEENDSSSGSYNCESGTFSLKFSKVNKGEHFGNLDMITTLLAPPKKRSTIIPNIEVIDSADVAENLNDNVTADNDNSEEWFFPQNVPQTTENVSFLNPKYGFANKLSGALHAFEPAWIREIIDLPTPDTTPEEERKNLRKKRESEDFKEDHYMADLMEPECIEPYITHTAEWDTLQKDDITFTGEEVDLLKELPNKEFLLDAADIRGLSFALVDILYASCYNYRTTEGENTVESGWTVNKLSSTLCWFQNFTSMDEVVTACFRRSLCYPLFRNWRLSMKVLDDVKKVLSLGKKYVIKRYCEVHKLFVHSYEPRYILNQLYIQDFLIWLQSCPESLIESAHSMLNEIQPSKASVGLDLVELEAAAYSVQEEGLVIENAVHKMVEEFDQMNMNNATNATNQSKTIYHVNQKEFKHLLSSSSSSESSDTDSDSSTTSSTSSSPLDSDDFSEPE